jgi:hypothetical protein
MIIGAQCLLVLLLLCYSIVSKGTWWVLLLLPALKGAVQTLVWVASVDLMQVSPAFVFVAWCGATP